MKSDTGDGAGSDAGTRRFGTGTRARICAMRAADYLRADGIVAVYHGRIATGPANCRLLRGSVGGGAMKRVAMRLALTADGIR